MPESRCIALRSVATASLAALLLLYPWPGAALHAQAQGISSDASAGDAEITRQQLEALEAEIAKITAAQQQRETQRSAVLKRLRANEEQLGELRKDLATLRKRMNESESELQELQRQRRALNEAAAVQRSAVSEELRRAYRGAENDQLKLLLSQENPELLARQLAYYGYVLGARNALLESYGNTLTEIAAVEQRVAATQRNLQQQQQDTETQQQLIAAEQSQRQALLAQLEQDIASDEQRLVQRQRDRSELEQVLADIEAAMAAMELPIDAQPFAEARGQMPWPVDGRLTQRFGSPRNQGRMRWQGVRLRAESGAAVNAIHHGRVVYSDWLRGAGLLLVLDHGDGYMSLYAHNETLLRDVGDWVSTGATIATVGDSGGQSEAGLYFEVRKDGTPTDPQAWCRG